MSEYKNDEMETRMEGGYNFGLLKGKSNPPTSSTANTQSTSSPANTPPKAENNHLKMVVNDVNDSVSIYNALPADVSFNYDDFVMRFKGEDKVKKANLKKAMKQLNLIRVLIEKSIRFKKKNLTILKGESIMIPT